MSQPPPYNPYYGNQPFPPQGAPPQPGMPPPMPPPMYHYNPPEEQQTAHGVESGGYDGDKQPIQYSDASIRRSFIRKVYFMITIMLTICFGMTTLAQFEENTKNFLRNYSWLYYVSYGVFLVTYLTIVCCQGPRRKFPINIILLLLLTLSMGYMTMMITSFHSTPIVFGAMGICAGVCLAITLFAMNTKYDFTSWIGVMFVIGMVLFFFGIFAVIFRSQVLMMVYAALAALVFMVYLAIDTQMIMGGKKHEISEEDWVFAATQLFVNIVYVLWMMDPLYIVAIQMIMGGKKHEISEEDWVFAATQLFVDIVYIFWMILSLMGSSD